VAKERDIPGEAAEWVGGSSDSEWWWFLQWSEYFRHPRLLRYLAFQTSIVHRRCSGWACHHAGQVAHPSSNRGQVSSLPTLFSRAPLALLIHYERDAKHPRCMHLDGNR